MRIHHRVSSGRRMRAARNTSTAVIARVRRGGVSLIEVVTVMAMSSVILGLSVTAIHLLLRAQRGAFRNVAQSQMLIQVSQLLRDDVHAATDAKIGPAGGDVVGGRLLLELPGGKTITYAASPRQIERVVHQSETVEHRDAFRLPDEAIVLFERSDAPASIRAIIRKPTLSDEVVATTRSNNSELQPTRVTRIEATLARDHRFALPQP